MITAFTIVFNGQPTIAQCIESTLRVADKQVIVEGAIQQCAYFTLDGRSTDNTNQILDAAAKRWGNRVVVIRKDGFWLDKLEMCNAALPHVEDGWLWQVDCDEFYHAEPLRALFQHLDQSENADITEVEFWAYHFFGSPSMHTALVPGNWGNVPPWRRLFRYAAGQEWASHEPPRLNRSAGRILGREETKQMGVYLYHYGYITRPQLMAKIVLHPYVNVMRHRDDVPFGQKWNLASCGIPVDISGHLTQPFTGQHPVDASLFQ